MVSLLQSLELLADIANEQALSVDMLAPANDVAEAEITYGVVDHPMHGRVYAYEVDVFGSYMMMDDANTPSLLALPYLGAVDADDPIYQRTRAYVLSAENPFFFKGSAAEGIGGPHIGRDMIWPMAITMRGL